MNLVGEKGQKLRQGWGSLGPNWLWVEFQPLGFTIRCGCNSQAAFEEAKGERVFGKRVVWSKVHGIHTRHDETRVITCFFALSFTWCSYSWEQVYGDSQRHWWYTLHLMLLGITSLWTLPWVQSIFSLMIALGSPFLGRLIWLIAANSQLKHGMRSWWLTCVSSSQHGRKIGSGRVAMY